MGNKTRIFTSRLTSRWTGSLQLWLLALALWSTISTLSLGASNDPVSYKEAGVANIAASIFVLAIIAAWKIVQFHYPTRISTLWVVLIGALVGFSKGLTTYYLFWELTNQAFTPSELFSAVVVPTVFGLFMIFGIGVVGAVWAEYNHERDLLISARAASIIQDDLAQQTHEEVIRLVQEARLAITATSQSPQEMSEALKSLAYFDIRDSSHELWSTEPKVPDRFRPSNLVIRTIRNHKFPVFLLAPIQFLGFISYQITQFSLAEAVAISLSQVVLVCSGLYVVSQIKSTRIFLDIFLFVSGPIAAVSLAILPAVLFGGQEITNTNLRLIVVTIIATWLLSIALGVVMLARHTHEEIVTELTRYFGKEIDSSASVIALNLQQRELAEYLHGYVQNFLLLSALRISNEPDSVTNVLRDVEQMWKRLESGQYQNIPPVENEREISQYFGELWDGVIDVRIKGVAGINYISRDLETLQRIFTELISNAHRHGQASRIDIEYSDLDGSIHLVAIDNGTGPGTGEPGLGSALLDAYTAHSWSIEKRLDSSGTVVRALIRSSMPTENQAI